MVTFNEDSLNTDARLFLRAYRMSSEPCPLLDEKIFLNHPEVGYKCMRAFVEYTNAVMDANETLNITLHELFKEFR